MPFSPRPTQLDRGEIVGDFADGTAEHGFILDKGRYTTIDVPGATLTQPMGINARGEIVGYYVGGGVTHGFLASEKSSRQAEDSH